ncbi:hypothetical protein ACIQGT_25410 [Streptomyces sp. NPDC093108]|uniref:hypothetical protein n=1 Tax=Streptomyces sp. NPDC093108 TaxID=3366030 RepID=UPI00382217E7
MEPETESGVIDQLSMLTFLEFLDDYFGQSGQFFQLDTEVGRVIKVRLVSPSPGGFHELSGMAGKGEERGEEFHEVAAQQHHQGTVVRHLFTRSASWGRAGENEVNGRPRGANRALVAYTCHAGGLAGRRSGTGHGRLGGDARDEAAGVATSHAQLREVRPMGFEGKAQNPAVPLHPSAPEERRGRKTQGESEKHSASRNQAFVITPCDITLVISPISVQVMAAVPL